MFWTSEQHQPSPGQLWNWGSLWCRNKISYLLSYRFSRRRSLAAEWGKRSRTEELRWSEPESVLSTDTTRARAGANWSQRRLRLADARGRGRGREWYEIWDGLYPPGLKRYHKDCLNYLSHVYIDSIYHMFKRYQKARSLKNSLYKFSGLLLAGLAYSGNN